jgi:Protein of unknown function (DUF433)
VAGTCQHQPAGLPWQGVYLRHDSGSPGGWVSHEELLQSYPSLPELDIQAALAYAAELAREGTADLPLEHTV